MNHGEVSEPRGPGRRDPERRQYTRLSSRLTVVFTVGANLKQQRALTRDIGGAGVCLVTEKRLRLGSILQAELKLPDRDLPVAFVARVVWNRSSFEGRRSYQDPKAEIGVTFVKIQDEDRAALVHFARMNALPSPS